MICRLSTLRTWNLQLTSKLQLPLINAWEKHGIALICNRLWSVTSTSLGLQLRATKKSWVQSKAACKLSGMQAAPARWATVAMQWQLWIVMPGCMVCRVYGLWMRVRFRFYHQAIRRVLFVSGLTSFCCCIVRLNAFTDFTTIDALAEKVADLIKNGEWREARICPICLI